MSSRLAHPPPPRQGTKYAGVRQDAVIQRAGFVIQQSLSYAPHAGWVTPQSGRIADALERFPNLRLLAGVQAVEPRMLMPAQRRQQRRRQPSPIGPSEPVVRIVPKIPFRPRSFCGGIATASFWPICLATIVERCGRCSRRPEGIGGPSSRIVAAFWRLRPCP